MSQPPRPDSWQAPDGWQPQWPGWSQPGYQQGYPTAPNQPGGYPSPHPAGGYSQTGTYQPSGAYPVQPPAQPARRFRPVQTLGIWAMVLAAIYTGFFAISALFSPVAAAEYKWALDVGRLEETLTTYDVFALVALLFLLPAAVVGIVWLWRARQNTFVFDPQARHERGDVWVILGWIVRSSPSGFRSRSFAMWSGTPSAGPSARSSASGGSRGSSPSAPETWPISRSTRSSVRPASRDSRRCLPRDPGRDRQHRFGDLLVADHPHCEP